MSARQRKVDCIYVTAAAHDARYTRICVASIRYFYPDAVIKLLPGGPLEKGLGEELARHWDVGVANIHPGNWGWGFVKLEPLFGPPGERFLVLDSDTVLVGDVLRTWAGSAADFMVDDEQQSEADTHRLYYDWRKIAAVDPAAQPPLFVFNSGQWFGTAGVLRRKDFAVLVNWSEMPPMLRHCELFMPGDQGVLNYVLNQKAKLKGVSVERQKIMRWPGHGLDGITAASVATRQAPPVIVHWAGMKRARLTDMVGGDILRFFEVLYYSQLPKSATRRLFASVRYPLDEWRHNVTRRIQLRITAKAR